MSKKFKPIQVANYILQKYGGDSDISQMKLQKLVYLAHAWWLAYNEEPLLSQKPEVWRYGPVFSSLYSRLKPYGRNPIKSPHFMPFEDKSEYIIDDDSEDVKNLIDWVWSRYGNLSASTLSDMTHKDGTPWQKIVKEYNYKVPANLELEDKVIREHYEHLKHEMLEGS